MSDDVTYYNQLLWQHYDNQITTANLNVEKFVSKSDYGISPPRIKLNISNFKNKSSSCVTLSHQDIFGFVSKFKDYETKLGNMSKEITDDSNKQFNFSVKVKRNLVVTFMHKVEYGGMCVRLVITDRNTDYLDSEKVYMTLYDFLSMMMIIGQFRMNYLQSVEASCSFVLMKDLGDKIDNLNSNIKGYYSEIIQKINMPVKEQSNHSISKPLEIPKEELVTPKVYVSDPGQPEVISYTAPNDYDPFGSSSTATVIEIPQTSSSTSNTQNLHNDLAGFITEKRDTYDIGIVDTPATASTQVKSAANVIQHEFTEKMLLNDVTNLEMYFTNLVNDDLPFSKFSNLIQSKLEFDPLESISSEDRNCLNYLITNYVKECVKNNLEKKQSIPANVAPTIIDDVTQNKNKVSLAFDLFLYCIYFGQLKNALKEKDYGVVANREMMCFILKTITAPYIFSVIKGMDENIVISELLNRFRSYTSAGVFSNIEKELLEKRSIKFTLSETAIKTEASRMFNVIVQKWNDFTIKASFSRLSNLIKLNHDDIIKNKLTDEQIKKILSVEFNFRKNGKVNFTEARVVSFDDIPASISEKFGLTKKKFDNTNLIRFVKEKCKDDKKSLDYCLEIVTKVNESYRDLKSVNVNYTIIPEEVLKALLLWDLNKDMKISTTYTYYLDSVSNSTLTKDMIMSLLTNIQEINDPTFTQSFIAARDE